jgi:predicted GNAT family acetyltransferase
VAIYRTQFNGDYVGLAHQFRVNPNSCGNHSHYEDYLKYCAITDHISGKGKTHIILDESKKHKRIVGFVTLKASSLIMKDDHSISGRSAVEITELAVDMNYEKKGFGRILMDLSLTIIDEIRHDHLGVEYVIACVDPVSMPFYVHMEFEKIADYYEVPREGWNIDCIPMVLRLPELD